MQQRTASPAVAAPHTLKLGGRAYGYGPLSFRARGELENVYFQAARSPYERYAEAVQQGLQEDPDYWQPQLDALRRASVGWRANLEEDQSREFFTTGPGRGELVRVALTEHTRPAPDPQTDWSALADELTKGQLDHVFAVCLETGEYAPKSSGRPGAGH